MTNPARSAHFKVTTKFRQYLIACVIVWQFAQPAMAIQDGKNDLRNSLLFFASFDKNADADFCKGDPKIYTAESLKRKKVQEGLKSDGVKLGVDSGRYGDALQFTKKSSKLIFFKGARNVPETGSDFSGAYLFWMKVDPEKDLPFDYVDPFQVTDKKWNDASFFVDFDKVKPRVFRLGVFSEYRSWNPGNVKWEQIPEKERPMVSVRKMPFSSERWTHVAICFDRFNSKRDGVAQLYLDGKFQGDIKGRQVFKWAPEKVVIMLGIHYVGLLDELAIFDRALSATEVMNVAKLELGLRSEFDLDK